MGNLNTYLNDHLAGSVAALELLDHLVETSKDAESKGFFTTLREEIDEDQRVLENLLRDLGKEESVVRKAGAWLIEKLSRAKLQVGAEDNALGIFQALEGLALGITGKKSLWRALAAARSSVNGLSALDYPRLEARAAEQFERVEARRLALAPSVFQPR